MRGAEFENIRGGVPTVGNGEVADRMSAFPGRRLREWRRNTGYGDKSVSLEKPYSLFFRVWFA